MNITIRRAADADAGQVLALLRGIARMHIDGRPDIFKETESKYGKDDLIRIFAGEKTPVFVAADENGTVAGYAFCIVKSINEHPLFKKRTYLYIDDLCVSGDFRRMGVGRDIMEHIKDYARSEGMESIELNVWAFNSSAVKFYESCGMSVQRMEMELKTDK